MKKETKIGVYYRDTNPQEEFENIIKEKMKKYGFIFDNEKPDVVFSIGGDGTFLRSIHRYIDRVNEILFIGIKAGTLGFFYEFGKEDIDEILEMLSKKDYLVGRFNTLKGEIVHLDGKKDTMYAINEMRIECPFRTLICDVYVNNELLERYRGNGLNVCTALGSTAYNKSLGGAIMEQNLPLMQLSEIAPISNNVYRSLNSPLVLSRNNTITFSADFSLVVLGYDYLSRDVSTAKEINITMSDKVVNVLQKREHSYIDTIKRSFVK